MPGKADARTLVGSQFASVTFGWQADVGGDRLSLWGPQAKDMESREGGCSGFKGLATSRLLL